MDFTGFPKIARLQRDIIVTEKIDGTNAQVCITDGGEFLVGSRTRWINPKEDNHGFAKWALEHQEELMELGPGQHFGEWWGKGIQRGYGLQEKRFSLFNTTRWGEARPACCHVVPILYQGPFSQWHIFGSLDKLIQEGSQAAPGFMKPEGVVVFHVAAGIGFKQTIENDEVPKGMVK